MRQRRWLELIKDYELEIHYHPSKANIVADALSRKSQVNLMVARPMPYELAKEFDRLSLGFMNNTWGVTIELEPTLEREIKEAQKIDEKISEIRRLILEGRGKDFREDAEGVIWFKARLCVPNVQSIWELILKESHETAYLIHPGSEKMYKDLKKKFWWYGMKREIAEHVAMCDSCRRIKVEHQRPAELLQPLQIPQWKWDEIGMDFIVGLPRTRAGYDSIWVVVNRLTKSAHYIPVKTNYSSAVLAELYMSQIVCLHGVPKKIVSDRGTQFTSHFWQQASSYMKPWAHIWISVQPIIRRQMVRPKGPIKSSKTCWEPVRCKISPNGTRDCLMQSSPIITVTRPAWRCHHFRRFMGGVVELHCNGISLEKSKCSGQTFCLKLKRTSRWSKRI
jgi:hypothetical protein